MQRWQSVKYLNPKIWELVPSNIKCSDSLSNFKKLINSWKAEACPCRLRKTYIPQVGFIYLIIYQSHIKVVTNFYVNFAQKTFFLKSFFFIAIAIISFGFGRMALFRQTFNRCELLCNFNKIECNNVMSTKATEF